MGASRAFYIVQGRLSVRGPNGLVNDESLTFADSDEGLSAFGKYLALSAAEPSIVLIDVIEEVFATDRIPKLAARDTSALLERRVKRKFPRTPYRLAVPGNLISPDKSERSIVFSSISNHELLDPWITVILRHQVPLIGIYSLPWMATKLISVLGRSEQPMLFLTQHQGNKLRQSFVQDGLVRSARLSQSPDHTDEAYPQFVQTEIMRSRRYLERSRLLGAMEELDVCMIAAPEIANQVLEAAAHDPSLKFHFIEPGVAKKRLHVADDVPDDRLECLFIASALRRRPNRSYAVSGEARYWQMSRMRRAIIATSIAVGAACASIAGIYLGDALRLSRESSTFDSQVVQLSETYRRENESLGPIKADSYEMKLAVDTGDHILQQRVPVPWVMHQLGSVLGDYPDVRIQQLSWQAETETVATPVRTRPGEPPPPVSIPATSAVTTRLSASIEPFDGNLRDAFLRIDQLANAIATRTEFVDVEVISYPIDARPAAMITGEINNQQSLPKAEFQLRLVRPLAPAAGTTGEASDEAV